MSEEEIRKEIKFQNQLLDIKEAEYDEWGRKLENERIRFDQIRTQILTFLDKNENPAALISKLRAMYSELFEEIINLEGKTKDKKSKKTVLALFAEIENLTDIARKLKKNSDKRNKVEEKKEEPKKEIPKNNFTPHSDPSFDTKKKYQPRAFQASKQPSKDNLVTVVRTNSADLSKDLHNEAKASSTAEAYPKDVSNLASTPKQNPFGNTQKASASSSKTPFGVKFAQKKEEETVKEVAQSDETKKEQAPAEKAKPKPVQLAILTPQKAEEKQKTTIGFNNSSGSSKPSPFGTQKPSPFAAQKPSPYAAQKPSSYAAQKPSSFGAQKPSPFGAAKSSFGAQKG